ncbi:MAG TPA: hypothetical protein VF643_13790 [Sphingomonas sp.]|jgi:hypothetical protein
METLNEHFEDVPDDGGQLRQPTQEGAGPAYACTGSPDLLAFVKVLARDLARADVAADSRRTRNPDLQDSACPQKTASAAHSTDTQRR